MAKTSALIIGTSMAGITAARVLANHFDEVTLIDRDELPDAPEMRNGVPQGRHIHVLLAKGQDILEGFFPGLSDELTASGAPRMTWCKDTCYFTPGGWIKRFDSGLNTNVITRPDLEWRVRRRLLENPKVKILSNRDVKTLLTSADKTTVTGVEVEVRGTRESEQHHADLIIDASGRNSKAPQWLAEIGYESPTETAVNANIGYATRFYEKNQDADWRVLFANARSAENNKRGAGIFDIGDNKWMVSIGGLNEDYPPSEADQFLEFIKTITTPTVYEVLKDAKPISDVYSYRIKGSRWRHYEKLTRRPENFILVGDSVCAFNPIYGQGITVAAMEAVELDALLKNRDVKQLAGFAGEFQRHIGKVSIKNAWVVATGEDLRFEGTEGDSVGFVNRLTQKYIDQYSKVAYDDEALTMAFVEVMNLKTPPTALFTPSILGRMIYKSVKALFAPTGNAHQDRTQLPQLH